MLNPGAHWVDQRASQGAGDNQGQESVMAGVTQGSSQFVASRRAAPGLTRELAELVRMFQALVADSYRPELHYMRGPGPKWHAKHDPAPAAASSHSVSGLTPASA